MSASPDRSASQDPVSPTLARILDGVAVYEGDGGGEWEDDDDMDFETADESNSEDYTELDSDDIEYHDGMEDLGSGVEIEFITDDSREATEEPAGDNDDDGGQTETEATRARATQTQRPVTITQHQILQLLGQAGLRGLFANHTGGRTTIPRAAAAADDDDEEEAQYYGYGSWGRRSQRNRRPKEVYKFPPIPNPEGQKLMESGNFGINERRRDIQSRKKKLGYRAMMRELGLGSPGIDRSHNKLISHDMIPSTKADTIINYNHRCYSGQFSDDGNFFFSCAQDFRVRMYDTSNPYKWKYYKTAQYHGGAWTITDATLSPDNKYLAYSSIRPEVCLAPTDPENTADPHVLDFANLGNDGRRRYAYGSQWGIWSIRFSGDGREIVAGTNDHSIYVYDIETNQSILRIQGHDDDVNAVCYGDKSSPHILYSGSDDTTLKVWDRRSLGDGREAGVFMGHTEGLTYIDSKGDGRYVLSNAKDQTMKLWDLRKMIPPDKAARIDPQDYTEGFDYRFAPYDETLRRGNPHDCSLVTFRGHKVLKTLIRCHFSPPGSTDGRYVYSGSHDGKVYVWNLDATPKAQIDVLEATRNSRPAQDERYVDRYDNSGRGHWSTIVRDVAWHPYAPVIAATSWNGWDHGLGTCTVHSWNDGMDDDEAEPKMGARVTAQLEHDPRFYADANAPGNVSQFRRARLRTRMGLAFGDDDDEDDE